MAPPPKCKTAAPAAVLVNASTAPERRSLGQSAFSRGPGRRYNRGKSAPRRQRALPFIRKQMSPAVAESAFRAGPCNAALRDRLRQRFDGAGEAALVAVGGVSVQHTLRCDAIDHALRLLQHALGGGLVARGDRFLHVLDRAAHRGAQAHVVDAALFRLAGALARGSDVCHEGGTGLKKGRIVAANPPSRKENCAPRRRARR